MASQGPNKAHNAAQVPGQAQVRRDGPNEPSDIHNQGQGTNFLQDTGTQVKNMAQGAAQGAVNLAQGAAAGAANMTSGAADAVKNTLGMNSAGNTANRPGNMGSAAVSNNPTGTDNPSNPSTRI